MSIASTLTWSQGEKKRMVHNNWWCKIRRLCEIPWFMSVLSKKPKKACLYLTIYTKFAFIGTIGRNLLFFHDNLITSSTFGAYLPQTDREVFLFCVLSIVLCLSFTLSTFLLTSGPTFLLFEPLPKLFFVTIFREVKCKNIYSELG